MNEPTITDWITAIAALFGIGPIVWGLVKLFLKDKEKEERLKFFQEQVDELKRQTSEYQYQSTLMRAANDLLEKQINLQTDIYLKTQDVETKKLEIEKIKRISDTKPHFVFQTAISSPDVFKLKLRNNGATADNIRIESSTDFIKMYPIKTNLRADKGEVIEINGYADRTQTFFNSSQVTGQILIAYKDADGREYLQNISKSGTRHNIDPPYLREG